MMRLMVATATMAALSCFGARSASAQQRDGSVRTRVSIQQPALAGVIGNAPLVFTKRTRGEDQGHEQGEGNGGRGRASDAQIVTAISSPVVRSNTAWRLRVTLLPPMDPTLTVTVVAKDGHEVALSATRMSAVVAEGTMACDRCEVRLTWEFVFAAEEKGKKTPPRVIPGIQYTAEPRR